MDRSLLLRRALSAVLALAVVAIAVPALIIGTASDAAPGGSAYVSKSKTVERVWQKLATPASATPTPTPSADPAPDPEVEDVEFDDDMTERTVTVMVDKTKELRGRERVHIAWSGARPTNGRARFPLGADVDAMEQEYPVVILQCRGQGDAVEPDTCWTSTKQQRSEVDITTPKEMRWRVDARATPAERAKKFSGMDEATAQSSCLKLDPETNKPVVPNVPGFGSDENYYTHLTPFATAKGTLYPACNGQTMPPEASPEAAFPPAEQAAFTAESGRGEADFEVRSDVENESLGCSDKVKCSIVVIPIMGISCAAKELAPDYDAATKRSASFVSCRDDADKQQPGKLYDGTGGNPWVSGRYWWSPSNWNNRFVIPITFGPPPNVCDLLDSRPPVGFFGSELMAQAGLQWAPAYCLDAKRFKFQANKMPDDAAFDLLGKGGADAAFVARARASSSGPVGYAPTAITGFAVSYLVDTPNSQGEVKTLRLTPRLIAKLLSTSYSAFSDTRDRRPGLVNNPVGINTDPEFRALNPGVMNTARQEGAALMSISVSSDVMWRLTEYLNRDTEARAFLNGNPDPWGMVVNPAYRGIKLPVGDWPLNDTWRRTRGEKCVIDNTTPFSTQLAAPVTSLRYIAESLIDAYPLMQTAASEVEQEIGGRVERICKYSRPPRLGVGERVMLGLVDLGDAERFGLRTAELQTAATNPGAKFTSRSGRTFVAPDANGMTKALASYARAGQSIPFTFDPKKIGSSGYPGTMVVYTAAKLTNLDTVKAKSVASFIRIATTEGQIPGDGNGRLPDGYLPLKKSGATAALWNQAQVVADLIEEQKAAPTPTPTATETPDPEDTATPDPAASASAAAAVAEQSAQAGPVTTVLETDPSAVRTSKIAALLLPLLILGAALCMLATPILRMMIAQSDDG